MRDRPTQASQTVVEILPNRLRALLMAMISIAVWVFAYFWLTNQFFDDDSFKNFVDHPDYYAGDLFKDHGPVVVLSVAAFILAINLYTVGSMLLPWPRPRLRVTRERFEARSAWRTKSFAWSEFGRFSVRNVRAGKTTTVRVRALPPGVADPEGILEWFKLKKTPELLSFDLMAFMPFRRNNVAEGEELVRWILDLRDGRDTPPPKMLTLRMTAAATNNKGAKTNAATGKMAKVTSNQTVVRR
jgi:hypothetical protein